MGLERSRKSLGILRKIEKKINTLDFRCAYEELYSNNYSFNFENLSCDFPKVNAKTMYMFLMYVISKNERVEQHIAICNYLYFMEPHVCGCDSLIKWHLLRSLKISSNNKDVLRNWIFGIYNGNPDNPFTASELETFHNQLEE